jgi:hypothetical protein
LSYVAVLEHLLDPRDQMQAVSALLGPGGYVFVSVPDGESFVQHTRAPFQQFSVEHINYFTGRSLANVMGAAGYRLVAQRRLVMRLGTDGRDPALEAIYRWDGVVRPVEPDPSGSDFIRAYVHECGQVEAGIAERLGRLAASGDPIYVWGTGTHTLHLLESSPLKDCRIEAFLDSNPHYTGGTLVGRPVLAPSRLSTVDAPILVGSAVSQSSIAAAARARFGPDVPLILLYEATDAPR